MKKKNPKAVIDSRHMKILTAKKSELKDAIVFVCLDDEKYGLYDIGQLRNLGAALDKIEPTGCYFICTKSLKMGIYDKAETKNKDIVVTVSRPASDGMKDEDIEESFRQAFSDARSIDFVHSYAESVETK